MLACCREQYFAERDSIGRGGSGRVGKIREILAYLL
jgi:hypothetical protein